MKKRGLAILALTVAVAFCLPIVAGCRKDDPDTESASGAVTEAPGSQYRDDLPDDLNYNGKDVNFLSRSHDWYNDEITLESSECVDTVDSRVYERELSVEKRLGVNIINTKLDGSGKEGYSVVIAALRQDNISGTFQYDIAVNNMYHTMSLASEGLFYDLNTVNYIDLDKPYYSQNFNDKATVNSSLYAVTGDAALTFIKFAFATFFNTQLVEQNHIDDLYQTVLDGKWTMDYQIRISKDVWSDSNGNQKPDEGDVFGFATNTVTGVDPYWSAFDIPIVQRDVNGKFTVGVKVEKMVASLTKINQLLWQADGTYVLAHESDDKELSRAEEMLANGKAMFTVLRLNACENAYLRNMETSYGIIPMPKYDEAQEQYYSYCHDLFSVFCISSGVSEDRIDMVGATLECFFSESDECRYALFDEALKVKYQSDEKNGKMLDIIIDNVKIDSGWIYSEAMNDFALCMRTLVQAKSSSFAGFWKMNQESLNTYITSFQDSFNK